MWITYVLLVAFVLVVAFSGIVIAFRDEPTAEREPQQSGQKRLCAVHIFSDTMRHAVTQPSTRPSIMQNTMKTWPDARRESIHLPNRAPSAVGIETDQPMVPIMPTDCQKDDSPSRRCFSRRS